MIWLPTRLHRDLFSALDKVLQLYNSYGFEISKIYCDQEFEPMMETVEDNLNVTMHCAAAQAHISEAERNNHTIRERVRATYQSFAEGYHVRTCT